MKDRAERIHKIVMDCLFRDEEIPRVESGEIEPLKAQGITATFGFHPERLAGHKEEIQTLLTELPKDFYRSGGGGWSFLNLCMDSDNHQWGEHRNMEELCVLAIASGLGQWCMPKEMWPLFPGGMPYVVFDL